MTPPISPDPAKRRLGRGLSGLIVSTAAPANPAEAAATGQYESAETPSAAPATDTPAAIVAPAIHEAPAVPGERSTEIPIDQISPAMRT